MIGRISSRKLVVSAVLVVGGVALLAPRPVRVFAQRATTAPAAREQAAPVAQALKQSWDGARKNIKASGDLMPEPNFPFKPVDTVRSFGEILAHVAGANYEFCSAAKGVKTPHAEDAFEKSATTRAAILKALDDSLVYCDAIYAEQTDKSLAEAITLPFGMGAGTRAAALMGNVGHLNEHYGNLVTYMRIKGIVPPSSRR